jgi:RimJ/RimL family protein N-acetyltransferase
MPSMVNPMHAFKTFEPAWKKGLIDVEPGQVDTTLLVHNDEAAGKKRFTFVRERGGTIIAMASFGPAEPFDGALVFQIGYAVPQHLRKRGIGTEIAQAAIAELANGLFQSGVERFFIEAMISVRNVASQKVAERVIGGTPEETTDDHSGEPALQYIKEFRREDA